VLLHAGTSKNMYVANNNDKLQEKSPVVLAAPDFKANSFLPSLLVF